MSSSANLLCPVCRRAFKAHGLENHFRQSPRCRDSIAAQQQQAPPVAFIDFSAGQSSRSSSTGENADDVGITKSFSMETHRRRSSRLVKQIGESATPAFIATSCSVSSLHEGNCHELEDSFPTPASEFPAFAEDSGASPSHLSRSTLGQVVTLDDDEELDMPLTYSNETMAMVRILRMCRNSGVPIKVTDKLLSTIHDEYARGNLSTSRPPPQSKTALSKLQLMFPMLVKPVLKRVPLETVSINAQLRHNPSFKMSPPIPVYSFLKQLQDLLSDPLFRDITNLDVDPNDRWRPFPATTSSREANGDWRLNDNSEVKDGEWQFNCNRRFGPHLPAEFHVFCIFYTDKTGKGAVAPISMEPFVFTLSLIKEEARRSHRSWRPLGFVPCYYNPHSKKKVFGKNVRNYHRILDALLESVVEVQNNPPTMKVILGDQFSYQRIVVKTDFLIGDGLNADQVTGRVCARNDTERISHACHASSRDADNPLHQCRFFMASFLERLTIAALGPDPCSDQTEWNHYVRSCMAEFRNSSASAAEQTKLKQCMLASLLRRMTIAQEILRRVFGQHAVDNAFCRLDMGDNPRGFTGFSSSDPMHIVENGIVPQLLQVVIGDMPDSMQTRLDRLAFSLFGSQWCRPGQRSAFPRVVLRNGFCTLSGLSSDQKMGKLLALTVMAHTVEGRSILDERCSEDFDMKKAGARNKFRGGKKKTPSQVDILKEGLCLS